jgi:hypothetical protein
MVLNSRTRREGWTTGGLAALVPAISDGRHDQSCDQRGQHPVGEAVCEIGPEGHLNLPSMIGGSTRSRNGQQVCPPLQHPSPWHVRSRSQINDGPNQIGQAAFSASPPHTLILAISPYGKRPTTYPSPRQKGGVGLFCHALLAAHAKFSEPSNVIGQGSTGGGGINVYQCHRDHPCRLALGACGRICCSVTAPECDQGTGFPPHSFGLSK